MEFRGCMWWKLFAIPLLWALSIFFILFTSGLDGFGVGWLLVTEVRIGSNGRFHIYIDGGAL